MVNTLPQRDFSLDDLYVFSKAVEIGTFTDTAKFFAVTISTIGRKIANLEDALGVKLIEKTNNSFHLTRIGKIVNDRVNEAKVGLGELKVIVKECIYHDTTPGELTIMMPPSIGANLISRYIPPFIRENPRLKLNICYQNKEPELVKDNIDVAIVPHITEKHVNQKFKKIAAYPIKLFCTKKYQEKYGIPVTPEELPQHLVVGILTDSLIISDTIDFTHIHTKKIYTISMPNYITSNNTLNNLELIRSDEAIGWAWDFSNLIEHNKDLVQVLPDYKQAPLTFYLLKHPYRKDKNLDIFANYIEDIFRQSRAKNNTNIL